MRSLLSISLWISICCPLILNPWGIAPVLAQNNPDRRSTADKLNQEGLNLAERGDFTAALAKYQQALAEFKAIGDRLNQGTVLSNICMANYYQGQTGIALGI